MSCRSRDIRGAGLSGCVTLMVLASNPALAQVAIPQASEAATEGGVDAGVETVVVNAQRREENVQKVPIAIAAVSGERLELAGVNKLDSINVVSPSVNIRQSAGNLTPYLRGIGTSASGVENPVALYVDGVYISTQREVGIDLIDVDQISVLKGPQGTLFGRNATAGVIQVSTRNPQFEPTADIQLGYDDFETLRSSAYVTGGITDSVAASATLQYVTQDQGWGYNPTRQEDAFYVDHALNARSKLLFKFGDANRLLLSADYQNRDEIGFIALRPFPGVAGFTPRFPYVDAGDPWSVQGNAPDFRKLESGGLSGTLDLDVGFAKLVNISAYRKVDNEYAFDADASPLTLLDITNKDTYETFSHEVQLVSPDGGKLNWILGAYYFYNDLKTEPNSLRFSGPFAPLPTSTQRRDTISHQQVDSYAGFGQATYEFQPDTHVTLGLRYTSEKRDFHVAEALTLNNGTFIPNALTPALTDRDLSNSKVTWRLALDHQFRPDIMGYVSYNRGFKSGGFNMTTSRNEAFLPETLDAYEAGLKTELFQSNLRLNVGAFYYDYDNVQVVSYTPTAFIQNGAKATLHGAEADFEALLGEEFSLSGGVALLDTKFDKFPNAGCSTNLPTGGATVAPCDVAGNRLPYASKVQASTTASYQRTTASIGAFAVSASALYNSGYYFEAENYLRQKAYVQVNTSINWSLPHKPLTISLWGRNLTDKAIAVFAPTQGAGAIGHQVVYGEPRTYGVTVRANFR